MVEPQPVNGNAGATKDDATERAENSLFHKLYSEIIPQTTTDFIINQSVADIWQHVLGQGLVEHLRAELLKKYSPPSNCLAIGPPKLNILVKNSASEAVTKRDERLTLLQRQMGSSLSALGQAITLLLPKESETDMCRVLELLGDVGNLLADLHHTESESRKILVSSNLKKQFKEVLLSSKIDEWLFGEDLPDRISGAKSLEKSAQDLKLVQPRPKSLNYPGPPRQPLRQPPVSGPKFQPRKTRSDGTSYNNKRPKPQQNEYRKKR